MLRRTLSARGLSECFEGIFLINLDRRPDRWAFFQDQFTRSISGDGGGGDASVAAALRLVERVPAVDGAGLDLDAVHRVGLLSRLGRRRLREPEGRRVWGMDLSPGAVGCALSHVKLWGRIAAHSRHSTNTNTTIGTQGEDVEGEPCFLVLEDDCVFPPPLPNGDGFEAQYRARLRSVPCDGWGLLYLSGLDTAGQCPALAVAAGVSRVPQFHRTTNAYVVTPSGARQLLARCVPFTYQIDTMMTMDVSAGESSLNSGGLVYVREPRCYTLMPPLILQSATVAGDIQGGEAARSPGERAAEEAERRRAAGWEDGQAKPLGG